MRTTLDIAEDVLQAAKERARRENKTAGEVISELARDELPFSDGAVVFLEIVAVDLIGDPALLAVAAGRVNDDERIDGLRDGRQELGLHVFELRRAATVLLSIRLHGGHNRLGGGRVVVVVDKVETAAQGEGGQYDEADDHFG